MKGILIEGDNNYWYDKPAIVRVSADSERVNVSDDQGFAVEKRWFDSKKLFSP
ncbi:MAG: hypothetical protein PF904_07210 [Kiritimatiellae bacterium]|jgi:hypothetical protein|nr:hypothetical protein [Kiritimatiellia bacterium]